MVKWSVYKNEQNAAAVRFGVGRTVCGCCGQRTDGGHGRRFGMDDSIAAHACVGAKWAAYRRVLRDEHGLHGGWRGPEYGGPRHHAPPKCGMAPAGRASPRSQSTARWGAL